MKPLLYHLEYHIQNGYFDRFPKGQEIKMVIGNDGGIQTLYGRGTGSGRVMFASGKSVLFAMDKSREELKVVFRAYTEDKFLGEAVKIFKGTSFPKRTEVGEPASYTFGCDLGFRKSTELVGAMKSFIRMTSFGENIISECIKDGDSYRVRMTSLVVERNKDPRKIMKPWYVILDGRRLRFSRWLRALEKADCTKDVFLKVKKCPDADNLPDVSEPFLNEEDEAALESVEAALKKDFEFIREFSSLETHDKDSQVDFSFDPSLYAMEINCLGTKTAESCYDKKQISTSCCQTSGTVIEDMSLKNNSGETFLSSTIQPSLTPSYNSENQGELLVSNHKQNTNNLVYFNSTQITDNDCDKNVPESNKTNESSVVNYKKIKADDIFHFERSTSDVFAENASVESSGVVSLISEQVHDANECVVEPPIVTGRSFLAETIVREIVDIIIDRVSEREYCSLEEHAMEDLMSAMKEDSSTNAVRVVEYGDTESLMDLSVLAKSSAYADLSIPRTSNTIWDNSTSSFEGNEEDKEERKSPKTIFICSNKKLEGLEDSNEECSSTNCKENKYIRTIDLQQDSDVSCILIKCSDQSNLTNSVYYRSPGTGIGPQYRESNEGLSNSQLYQKGTVDNMRPTSSVEHGISEWLKEDVIAPCFTCGEEKNNDLFSKERWKRTIITNQTSFTESAETSSLPRPDDECRPDITYSSDEVQPNQISSNIHHTESESNSNHADKSSSENSRVSQITKNKNQEIDADYFFE